MMRPGRLVDLVVTNLRSSRATALFAILGVAVGAAFLTFFVGLGEGLRSRVLNRILPANQLELEPRSLRVFGVEGTPSLAALDDDRVGQLLGIDGVSRALGRKRSAFPAKLWGGQRLIGYDLHTEAFFDGVPAELLAPELATFEASLDLGRRRAERCDVDDDCPAGARCEDGLCGEVHWAERFAARDLAIRCQVDDDCPVETRCDGAHCRPQRATGCLPGEVAVALPVGERDSGGDARPRGHDAAATVCAPGCDGDADCLESERCVVEALANGGGDGGPGSRDAGSGRCVARRCTLAEPGHQRSLERRQARGTLVAARGQQARVAGDGCPGRSYCAGDWPDAHVGACELPIPVVLNPLLLEVFNTDMAASLGVARVAAPEALLGVRFHLALGDSHFTADAPRRRQQIRQAVVVGFSAKAPELGATVPLRAVQAWNARFLGREASAGYDGVIVETEGNEVIAGVISVAERAGLQLSRRSRLARTFGTVVLLVYLALVLLALVVLSVAALGIAHTFAILVHERRREIAVLRAIGASSRDIFALVVLEACVLGLAGGLVGLLLAHLGALTVNAAAQRWLHDVPLLPQQLFEFPWWAAPLPVAVGVVFCAIGASLPARRATALDPATVLSQP